MGDPNLIAPMSSVPAACDDGQLLEFENSKSLAEGMAGDAFTHVQSLYSYTFDPGGSLIGHFAASPRYTKWFGPHGTPFDPSAMDPVNSTINQALLAIKARISDDQSVSKPVMTATCQCDVADLPPPATPQNATAWVIPNDLYVVNTCPLFWDSPSTPLVRDQNSKVGTIIHEAVHFSDLYWTGSVDHYGVSYVDAEILALEDRSKSAINPNTYVFFILNQVW